MNTNDDANELGELISKMKTIIDSFKLSAFNVDVKPILDSFQHSSFNVGVNPILDSFQHSNFNMGLKPMLDSFQHSNFNVDVQPILDSFQHSNFNADVKPILDSLQHSAFNMSVKPILDSFKHSNFNVGVKPILDSFQHSNFNVGVQPILDSFQHSTFNMGVQPILDSFQHSAFNVGVQPILNSLADSLAAPSLALNSLADSLAAPSLALNSLADSLAAPSLALNSLADSLAGPTLALNSIVSGSLRISTLFSEQLAGGNLPPNSPIQTLEKPTLAWDYLSGVNTASVQLPGGMDNELWTVLGDLGGDFQEMLEGAWAALTTRGADSGRQTAHSARELIDWVLRTLAPDSAFDAEDLGHAGFNKPTRRMRLERILGAQMGAKSLRRVYRNLESTHGELDAVAHTGSGSARYVRGLVRSVEGILLIVFGRRRRN